MTSTGKIQYPEGTATFIYNTDEERKWQSFIANLNAAPAVKGFKMNAGFGVIKSETEAYIYINSLTAEKLDNKKKNNNMTLNIEDKLTWYVIGEQKEYKNVLTIQLTPGDTAVAEVVGVFKYNDLK